MVVPRNASSGVSLKYVQASCIACRNDSSGDVPGLQSVATAIGTPCARNSSSGGSVVSRNTWNAPGSSTATVPAAAIARTPASSVCSMWSADSPTNSAASAAPPPSLN